MRGLIATIALGTALVASACGSSDAASLPPAKTSRFDAGRALALAKLQVAYGQRPAGSPRLRRLAGELRTRLPRGRFEAVPGHPGLRNIVGSIPGNGRPVVLAAHYDTESHPPGFVGANDGAAGTAVVLEAARALRKAKRPPGAPPVRFVLFDGEEEPRPTDDFYGDALRGSKAYAARHAREIRALVLVDYVGNKGLRLPREATSDEALWQVVRASARTAGVGRVFPDAVGGGVIDDHTPFLRRGVTAVDLIDFDYEYADTTADTIDKLDARALDATGETVVQLLGFSLTAGGRP